MKNILFLIFLNGSLVCAQGILGTVTYQKTTVKKITNHNLYFNDSVTIYIRKESAGKSIDTISTTNGAEIVYNRSIGKKPSYNKFLRNEGVFFTRNFIDGQPYSIRYPKLQRNWEYLTEKKTCGSYTCHKASILFSGKRYFAWYVPEIPLPYGPANFFGLKGLIVEVEDELGKNLYFAKRINLTRDNKTNRIVEIIDDLKVDGEMEISFSQYLSLKEKMDREFDAKLNARRPKGSKPIKFRKDCESCN